MSALELFPYQHVGADYLATRSRAGLFDEMGVGKSAQAIKALDTLGLRRGLVICPAGVREVWAGEFRKFAERPRRIIKGKDIQDLNLWLRGKVDVLLLSYEMATSWAKRMEGDIFDFAIFDECFPGSTMVGTEQGPVSISELVENRMDVRVLCRGPEGLAFKTVTRYIKAKPAFDLLRVEHEAGDLVCTANHKLFVEGKGYVRADCISEGDRLRVVQCSGDILLSVPAEEVLQSEVFGELAQSLPPMRGGQEQEDARWSTRDAPAGRVGEDEAPQFKPGISRQTGHYIEVAERSDVAGLERRQRLHHRPTEASMRGFGSSRSTDGISDSYCSSEGLLSVAAEQLQGRHSDTVVDDCDRGGRFEPQDKEVGVLGPAEDGGTYLSRVERVSLHESRGERTTTVYNIEVEDFHNYFADGVLVGNCHYLKSKGAIRTKQLLGAECDGRHGLAKWAAYVWFLTGTPAPNDVADVWSVMRFCGATPLTQRIFQDRYFRKIQGPYSSRHELRETMVPELKQAIKSFSLRRTKKDVKLELPPVWLTTTTVDGDTAEIRNLLRGHPGLEAAIVQAVEKGGLSFLEAQHIMTLRRLVGEAKAPGFTNLLLEELRDGLSKVVVFGIHKRAIEIIRSGLERAGVRALRVDGSTSDHARAEAVRSFQNDDVRVFLGNIRAAGTGTTLTAASNVIMFEQDWSPAANVQALMRCHRIGQTQDVHARFIILARSIDEHVAEVLARKTANLIKIGTLNTDFAAA